MSAARCLHIVLSNHTERSSRADLLRHRTLALPVLALTLVLLPARDASAGCPRRSDISVTTNVTDFDTAGSPYTISSDGLGSYFNGKDGVTSILTGNTYNCVPTGDWQFNKPYTVKGKTVYSNRRMGVSLNTSDAIVLGDPHYTVTADPPFWGGPQILISYAEVKCSLVYVSMGTMAANTAATCPMLFEFITTDNVAWGLSPAQSFNHFPEVTDAQISCNSVDAGGCKDWFIEPIGSLQAVGRLGSGGINHGDFYMRFKVHVTRP